MANLTNTSTWEAGIYQLEATDPVQGGPGGVSNQQAQQLSNRTNWLRDRIYRKVDGFTDVTGALTLDSSQLNHMVSVKGTPSAYTVTLPAASTVAAGQGYHIAHDQSSNVVYFVAAAGSDVIDMNNNTSRADIIVKPLQAFWLISNGSNRWYQIGDNPLQGVGQIAAFCASTPPAGWLECNGALVSKTDYRDLWDQVGTLFGSNTTQFNLPDLRGEFVRGWSNGRSVDTGRALGSSQNWQVGTHSHNLLSGANIESGNEFLNETSSVVNQTPLTGTSGENRPRNIALMYCIKY